MQNVCGIKMRPDGLVDRRKGAMCRDEAKQNEKKSCNFSPEIQFLKKRNRCADVFHFFSSFKRRRNKERKNIQNFPSMRLFANERRCGFRRKKCTIKSSSSFDFGTEEMCVQGAPLWHVPFALNFHYARKLAFAVCKRPDKRQKDVFMHTQGSVLDFFLLAFGKRNKKRRKIQFLSPTTHNRKTVASSGSLSHFQDFDSSRFVIFLELGLMCLRRN